MMKPDMSAHVKPAVRQLLHKPTRIAELVGSADNKVGSARNESTRSDWSLRGEVFGKVRMD
jgi:hypothetical protein